MHMWVVSLSCWFEIVLTVLLGLLLLISDSIVLWSFFKHCVTFIVFSRMGFHCRLPISSWSLSLIEASVINPSSAGGSVVKLFGLWFLARFVSFFDIIWMFCLIYLSSSRVWSSSNLSWLYHLCHRTIVLLLSSHFMHLFYDFHGRREQCQLVPV